MSNANPNKEFSWDDFEEVQPTSEVPVETQIQNEDPPVNPQQFSQLDSLLGGIGEGSSLGYGDEASSGVTAGLDVLTGNSPSLPEESSLDKYKRLYNDYLTGIRGRQKALEQANPKTFLAGDLASAVATPAPIIGGAKLLTKGKSVKELLDTYKNLNRAKQAATIAGEGALGAYGRSEDNGATDASLGAVAGLGMGAFGKAGAKGLDYVRRRGNVEDIPKVAGELLGDSSDQALRSINADKDVFTDALKAETRAAMQNKQLQPEDLSGVVGVREGIIDPLVKPRQSYQKALEFKSRIGDSYNKEYDKLHGYAVKDLDEAKEVASQLHSEIYDQLDQFAKTDLKLSEEQKLKLMRQADALKDELEVAFLSDNPMKELQNLYVKYNKDAFSNRASGDVAKVMRNAIKGKQRSLINELDPNIGQEFSKLDKEYSAALDLENMAEEFAAKSKSKGTAFTLGDWVASGVLSGVTDIPGIGPAYLAGSKAVKSATGKDITDIIPAYGAQKKYQDYVSLQNKLEKLKDQGLDKTKISSAIEGAQNTLGQLGPAGLNTARVAGQISPITSKSNDQLYSDAQQLKQHPSKQAQYVGDKLEKAAQGDDVKKAAVNFDLQQRPESRAVMKEQFDWGDFDEMEDEKDRDGY
jgi:hypothetical protein